MIIICKLIGDICQRKYQVTETNHYGAAQRVFAIKMLPLSPPSLLANHTKIHFLTFNSKSKVQIYLIFPHKQHIFILQDKAFLLCSCLQSFENRLSVSEKQMPFIVCVSRCHALILCHMSAFITNKFDLNLIPVKYDQLINIVV